MPPGGPRSGALKSSPKKPLGRGKWFTVHLAVSAHPDPPTSIIATGNWRVKLRAASIDERAAVGLTALTYAWAQPHDRLPKPFKGRFIGFGAQASIP